MATTGKGLPRSMKSAKLDIPAATPTAVGGVKQSAAVNNIATQTVSGADAAAVATSATTAVNAVGTKLNALLAALRAAGIQVS